MPISFDRVADIYDETRRMPDEVIERIVDAIAHEIDPSGGLLLEIGIGTGRISVPLAKKGFRVIGIDISDKMLAHLRAKSAQLANPPRAGRGDVTRLPFHDHAFRAVLAVHVFHLIDDLDACLMEARRVLLPGGRLLFGGEQRQLRYVDDLLREDADQRIRDELIEMFEECGVKLRDQGEIERRVADAVLQMGAKLEQFSPVEWDYEVTCGEIVERIEQRVTSSLWNVPDDTLKELVERVNSSLEAKVGPPSTVLRFRRSFRMMCAAFPQ